MHILSPETDNCPSWISGRERITVENISWSISTKECCRPRRELNRRPPGLLVSSQMSHPTEPPRPAHFNVRSVWLVFIVTIFIAISILNANSEDPDDSAFRYIWSFVYTVCQCPFHVMLGMNKLIFWRGVCVGRGGGGLGGSWNLTAQSTSLRSCRTGKWVNKVLSITLL